MSTVESGLNWLNFFASQKLSIYSFLWAFFFVFLDEFSIAQTVNFSTAPVVQAESVLYFSQAVWGAIERSPQVKQAAEELSIALLEEPGLLAMTDPAFGIKAYALDDRGPRSAPAIQGAFAKSKNLDLALNQNWLIGTEAQLFFKTQEMDSPAIFRPLNPSIDSQLGLEIKQPLLRYLWGRPDIAKRKQSRARVRGAQWRLERARESIGFHAASAYLEVYLARENIQIREAALEDSKRLRNKYFEKKRYGLIEESDMLQAEASVRAQEVELLLSRSQLVQAENALRWALYISSSVQSINFLQIPSIRHESSFLFEEPLQTALKTRGDLQAGIAEMDRLEWFLRYEKLNTLPELSVFGSYASAGLNTHTSDAWQDAASFASPIFSGGLQFQMALGQKRERIRKEEASRRLDAARAEVERLEDQVRREVADALERLSLARSRTAAYKELLEIEGKKFLAGEEDYKRGRLSIDLLIRFQGDIHRTKYALLKAQNDEIMGQLELWYSIGKFLDYLQGGKKS